MCTIKKTINRIKHYETWDINRKICLNLLIKERSDKLGIQNFDFFKKKQLII